MTVEQLTKFSVLLRALIHDIGIGNDKPFWTIRDIIDSLREQYAIPQRITSMHQRGVYHTIYRRMDYLATIGCLMTTKLEIGGTPTGYRFHPTTVALLSGWLETLGAANADADKETLTSMLVEELMRKFDLKDLPYTPLKHPRKWKNKTDMPLFMDDSIVQPPKLEQQPATETGMIKVTLPNKTVMELTIEQAKEFFAGENIRPTTVAVINTKKAADVPNAMTIIETSADALSAQDTIAVCVANMYRGFALAVDKLHTFARSKNKHVSIRALSVALSQCESIMLGLKYDLSYHACRTIDDVPCNTDECNILALSEQYKTYLRKYLDELVSTTADWFNAPEMPHLTVPTLAPGKGEKEHKVPWSFRASPHLIHWEFRGKLLPPHLMKILKEKQEKLARRRARRLDKHA